MQVLLLAHGVIGGVQHHGHFHQFRGLEVDDAQWQPATCAVHFTADSGNQHDHQEENSQCKQGYSQLLPHAQGHGGGKHGQHHAHHDEQGVAYHKVVATVAFIARPVCQSDRGRIHHQQTEQGQHQGSGQQGAIKRRQCRASRTYGIDTRGQLSKQTHASSPLSRAISVTAATKHMPRW